MDVNRNFGGEGVVSIKKFGFLHSQFLQIQANFLFSLATLLAGCLPHDSLPQHFVKIQFRFCPVYMLRESV